MVPNLRTENKTGSVDLKPGDVELPHLSPPTVGPGCVPAMFRPLACMQLIFGIIWNTSG